MSKVTFQFQLPDESEELNTYIQAEDFKAALWDVSQEVFRPARKHGYPNQDIQNLIQKLDSCVDRLNGENALSDDWPKDDYGPLTATDLVALLEKEFYRILDHHGVEL